MLKPETVRWLQWVLQRGGFSRAGSARELCERDGWRDRRFEALQMRSDELYRQSAEITARVAHTEAS